MERERGVDEEEEKESRERGETHTQQMEAADERTGGMFTGQELKRYIDRGKVKDKH